jgi:hypothetical protein
MEEMTKSPFRGTTLFNEDLEYDEYSEEISEDEDSDVELIENPINSRLIKTNIIDKGSNEVGREVDAAIGLLQKNYDILQHSHSPRFNLNFLKLEEIPESDLLLSNLDLVLSYRGIANIRSTVKFDKDFVYNGDKVRRFKRLIFKRDGYLNDEINYFELRDDNFSEYTKCIMLRNSRVILFGRNVEIEHSVRQRILSAGVLLLIGELSRDELASYIKSKLPNGQFEVSIKYEHNTYVLIGIESPLLKF